MIELTIVVPIILAVIQAVKMAGMPSKFAPILSIVLGVAVFYFVGNGDAASNIFEGFVAGLSASGLYSGGRVTKKMVLE